MKKKLTFAALAAMTSFSMLAVIFSSIAWFNTKTTVSPSDKLEGESDGAYFGGGDGLTADTAYIISTPRHLYNLAWLQYLGWFNGNDNGVTQADSSKTLSTTYFKLAADIDMSGWTLPPIGTTKYPFIGNFNGNGKKISNLTTINSSNINDYNKIPSPVRTAGTVTDVNIVGLFGVIGEVNDNIPATYSTAANSVYNFEINTYSAKPYTANSLVGMAAGYVNGTLSGVGVAASDIDLTNQDTSAYSYTYGGTTKAFPKVSDYSVVGYAEPAYKKTIEKTVTNNYNPVFTQDEEGFVGQAGGTAAGWGGSMNMKSAYDGLRQIWDKAKLNKILYTIYNGVVHYLRYSGTTLSDTTSASEATEWEAYVYNNNVYPRFDDYYYLYCNTSGTLSANTTRGFCFEDGSDGSDGAKLYYDTRGRYLYFNGTSWATTTNSGQASICYLSYLEAGWDGTYEDSANNIYTKINGGHYYYINNRTYEKNESGTVVSETSTYGAQQSSGNYSLFSDSVKDDQGRRYSSYTFQYRNNTDRFLYCYGDEKYGIANGTTIATTEYQTVTVDGAAFKMYFTDPATSTKYYLHRTSGETLSYTSDSDTASTWYEDDGYVYTVEHTTTGDNDTRYYLRFNSNNIILVSTTEADVATNATQLRWDSTRNMYYMYNNYYPYFDVDSKTWKYQTGYTYEDKSNAYYLISGDNGTGTVFLGSSGTTLNTTAVSMANATHFSREYYNNNYYYYILSGNTKYYVGRTSGNTPTLTTNRANAYYTYYQNQDATTTASSTRLMTSGGYYLRYNGGSWQTRSNGTNNVYHRAAGVVQRNLPVTYDDLPESAQTYKERHTTTTTETAYIQTKPTYFPLNQEMTNDIPNGIPSDSNTGYFVGSGTNVSQGDMRISEYYADTNLNGYSGDSSGVTLDTVRTINASGDVTISSTMANNYERYNAAKSALETVLADGYRSIYGLHFMQSDIQFGIHDGVDRSVYAEHALVNGDEFFNYELPRACIDFNLKEKGFINFIAGAYFDGNNCFFTINKVYRDANHKITAIKNIREIYSDGVTTHGIIYKFDDGTYTVPYQIVNGVKKNWAGTADYVETTSSTAPTSYSSSYAKVFDCSWIDTEKSLSYTGSGGSTKGYAYYFELPMNDGEFCMGSPSFDGAAGAYLMYLDIGANAKKIYRTTVYEVIEKIEEEFEIPLGVGIIVSGGTASDMNSYCVTIESSYNGKVSFNRSSASAATYTESVASNNVYMTYKSDDIAVNTNEEPTALRTVVTTYERLTFYDFSPNMASTTKTILTKSTVVTNGDTANATTTYTAEQWSGYTDTSVGTPVASGDMIIFGPDGVDVTATYSTALTFSNDDVNTLIYTIRNIYTDQGTLTITFNLTTTSTATDVYTLYDITGYNISIVLTKNTGVTVDITDECTVTYDNHGTWTITINGQTYTVNVPQTINGVDPS